MMAPFAVDEGPGFCSEPGDFDFCFQEMPRI